MLADFGMDFLNDGDSGEKSLQRDAIVGHWDGHTLNLGGVGRMAAEHRCVVGRALIRSLLWHASCASLYYWMLEPRSMI